MSHPRCHCATPQESRLPGPPTNLSLLGFSALSCAAIGSRKPGVTVSRNGRRPAWMSYRGRDYSAITW